MFPASELPVQVQNAPEVVLESYQFAIANPELLKQVPCYCGCDAVGHQSNYACYASGTDSSGAINYDGHALGCSICVDITQDVMRMHKEGKSLEEIQVAIDQIYSKYGPSNMPSDE